MLLLGGGAAAIIFGLKNGEGESTAAPGATKKPAPKPSAPSKEPTEAEEPEVEEIATPAADALFAWGLGAYGLLGDDVHHGDFSTDITYSPDAAVPNPQAVELPAELGVGEITQISTGTAHTLALTGDGEVLGWGWHGIASLYGGGMAEVTMTPTKILTLADTGGEKIIKIAAGAAHSFALGESGSLYAWGYGIEGVLGDGHNYPHDPADQEQDDWDDAANFTPHKINDQGTLVGVEIVDIAAGPSTAFAIDKNGDIHGWGLGYSGMLGTGQEFVVEDAEWGYIPGDSHYSAVPVSVDVAAPWRAGELSGVRVGSGHVVALTTDGKVYTWGTGLGGQLGDGENYTGGYGLMPDEEVGGNPHTQTAVPVKTEDMSGPVTKICAGYGHSMALTAGGKLWGWGANTYGQIAQPESRTFLEPVEIPGLLGEVIDMNCSPLGGLALLDNGDLYSWGWSGLGQLGDGVQHVSGGSDRDAFEVLDDIFSSFEAKPRLVNLPEGVTVTHLEPSSYHTVIGVVSE